LGVVSACQQMKSHNQIILSGDNLKDNWNPWVRHILILEPGRKSNHIQILVKVLDPVHK